MLAKKKRITKNTFQTIMEKGSIVSGSFFLLRYLRQPSPIYAFVAPKKIAKTAVKRNSLRRIGYNILRSYDLESCAGIFFYKKEALSATNIDLKKDIETILKKINLI
ncbi:MAG: ribonuclease P protein component [Candidatus Paceibacterota bacterium]